MTRDELMRTYGELVIQAEILNGRIMEVKKQIAEVLNQPPIQPEVKPQEK